MKTWQLGLVVVLVAGLINGLLISAGIGGIIRELARLSILVGMGVLVFGLIRRK